MRSTAGAAGNGPTHRRPDGLFRQFFQEVERNGNAFEPDLPPADIAEPADPVNGVAAAPGRAEMNQSDRFFRASATGSRDSGDGDGEIGA